MMEANVILPSLGGAELDTDVPLWIGESMLICECLDGI